MGVCNIRNTLNLSFVDLISNMQCISNFLFSRRFCVDFQTKEKKIWPYSDPDSSKICQPFWDFWHKDFQPFWDFLTSKTPKWLEILASDLQHFLDYQNFWIYLVHEFTGFSTSQSKLTGFCSNFDRIAGFSRTTSSCVYFSSKISRFDENRLWFVMCRFIKYVQILAHLCETDFDVKFWFFQKKKWHVKMAT